MNNNEKIYNCLIELSKEIMKREDIEGVETSEISEIVNLRRNVVSHHLNKLVEEGKAIKTKTRPVYFIAKDVIEEYRRDSIKSKKDFGNVFTQLVGYDGSLKASVEQCKVSVFYPNGMPVLFTGKSGVGKSYLANLVYSYAIEKNIIDKNAPFITFNCADYANNPGLLSANLFGYKKGAFTGADKDHEGLIEAADGGYLFLDEVHRLSSEGQEKLFIFLDQGIYKRLGETKENRKANVRMLFATTESPKENLLETFVRRIPLVINIPSLDERSVEERIMLIYNFFYKEAINIDKDIRVNKNVVNFILSQNRSGNVGSLKNLVKIACACAYKQNITDSEILVSMNDISYIEAEVSDIKEYFTEENLYIDRNIQSLITNSDLDEDVYKYIEKIFMDIRENISVFLNNSITKEEFLKMLNNTINMSLDLIIYNDNNDKNDIINKMYEDIISKILKAIEINYGLKYYGNTSKVITKIIRFFKNYPMIKTESVKQMAIDINKVLDKILDKEKIIIDSLLNNIKQNLDITIDIRMRVFIALYIKVLFRKNSTNINALIVAHGYSTASSIASVANMLYEEFVFESFDMHIDMKNEEIVKKIKNRLKQMDTSKDTLILVDMGSLLNIHEELKGTLHGNIGVINNITTNIALDIAGKILNNESLISMLEAIQKKAKIECRYYEGKKKKKAIITTCITGIGTAIKLRDLIKRCVSNSNIEVVACEYNKLVSFGKNDSVLKEYDVALIISTTEINIEGIKCILLENLMSDDTEKYLRDIFEAAQIDKDIDIIREDMAKLFSLENIINQLTILNPNKIINDVENIINNLQCYLDILFKMDLKMVLYIHISVMIERLMLKQGLVSQKDEDSYLKSNKKFAQITEKVFSVIEKEYKIELTVKEIEILQGIIESRSGKLNI